MIDAAHHAQPRVVLDILAGQLMILQAAPRAIGSALVGAQAQFDPSCAHAAPDLTRIGIDRAGIG